MRLAALFLAAGLAIPALAQQPGSQPATGSPPPTGTPASTGSNITIQPVEPPKPAEIPVPDGPVVNKQELEGGLIIEDIKIGEGYEVKPGGAVVALYHGTLKENGKIFDSAFKRGEPIAFPLGGVIQGWQKGVPGMKIGGVRKLTIPAALGYGAQGAGQDIPPNADLVFVIQLVDALQIEDITPGDGEEVADRCVAVTTQTIKDKDGKEVDKSDAAHPYIWIPGEMSTQSGMDAMQTALAGMKVGGKRKVVVPKEMNAAPPGLEIKRPTNVPITVELELVAVRNLAPRRK